MAGERRWPFSYLFLKNPAGWYTSYEASDPNENSASGGTRSVGLNAKHSCNKEAF